MHVKIVLVRKEFSVKIDESDGRQNVAEHLFMIDYQNIGIQESKVQGPPLSGWCL